MLFNALKHVSSLLSLFLTCLINIYFFKVFFKVGLRRYLQKGTGWLPEIKAKKAWYLFLIPHLLPLFPLSALSFWGTKNISVSYLNSRWSPGSKRILLKPCSISWQLKSYISNAFDILTYNSRSSFPSKEQSTFINSWGAISEQWSYYMCSSYTM